MTTRVRKKGNRPLTAQNTLTMTMYRGRHLPEVSRFVASIYHASPHMHFDESEDTLATTIEKEDRRLACNTILACLRNGEGHLQATLRMIRRGGQVRRLPCEREFGLDLDLFQSTFRNIYEFARLASTGGLGLISTGRMFTEMRTRAGVDYENDFLVASLDATVLGVLKRRGWPVFPLGTGKEYLGSLTIPVGFALPELSQFEARWAASPPAMEVSTATEDESCLVG
jgi:hypothetical protein